MISLPPIGDALRDRASERRARERARRERSRRREQAAADRLAKLEAAARGLSEADRRFLFPALEARRPRPPAVKWRWAR